MALKPLGNGSSEGALLRYFRSGLGGRLVCACRAACGGVRRGANGAFANEDGTSFDRKRLGFDVPDDFGARLEFDSVCRGEITVNFTVNDDRGSFDFRTDAGIFTNRQISIRVDFPLDLAIHDEIIGEFDVAFNFDIGGEDVASGTTGRADGCDWLLGTIGRCRWCWNGLRKASFWMRRGEAGGFTIVLANYFFEHGDKIVGIDKKSN